MGIHIDLKTKQDIILNANRDHIAPKSKRTVTGLLVGFVRDVHDELGANVLELVFKFDRLGDCDAVFCDFRGAPGLFDNDASSLRSSND